MTESAVRIGEAAALYDLAPSTLRWWEKQGVLDPPRHGDGRRRYDATDLRRAGLAHLCCVTGMMRLDRAAIVTSGRTDLAEWQQVVREEVLHLEQRIERMTAARDYLAHLLTCRDDDVARCPELDHHLLANTPRGRFAEPDLLAAARQAGVGDGMAADVDETPPASPGCRHCGLPVAQPRAGRRRRYCSAVCRQSAYRARRSRRPT